MHRADIPDIRAKELLTVIALSEYGSFVAAAAHLKTSQPALTRTVKRVERVLGVTLFARNTRRVEITDAGREFVAVAERVLNDLQLTDLRDEPLVSGPSDTYLRRLIDGAATSAGYSLQYVVTVDRLLSVTHH